MGQGQVDSSFERSGGEGVTKGEWLMRGGGSL